LKVTLTKEKYIKKKRNIICTTKLDNFLDNPISHTHIMRKSKKIMRVLERRLYKKLSNLVVQIKDIKSKNNIIIIKKKNAVAIMK
jgi:hypothetical protein